MVTLTVGLQYCPQNDGSQWDENECFKMVNRFGKKLETIGYLDEIQKIMVVSYAQEGGFFEWHDLSNSEGLSISSHLNDCQTMLSFMVSFKELGLGKSPQNMDQSLIRSFVRDFGHDLEQFQGLARSQMNAIAYRLCNAGFVNCFTVQGDCPENRLAVSDMCDTGMEQPAGPPSSVPFLPSCNPVRLDFPNTPQMFHLESEVGSLVEHDYSEIMGNQPLGALQLDSGACSTLNSPPHGPQGDWTSLASDEDLGRQRYPTVCLSNDNSSLLRPEITSLVTVSTPELDEGLSYPTPSTICAETPRMIEQYATPRFGTPGPGEVSEANSSDQAILDLLRSCQVSVKRSHRERCPDELLENLDDYRITKIIEADSLLLAKDPDRILRPLLDKWDTNKPLNLPALGLPFQWKGIQAAVDYLRLLDAGPRKSGFDPITERLGYVMLYLNYKELCKTPEKYCSLLPGKSKKTSILDRILDCYSDDPRISNSRQSRRNRITTYHIRRGEWWWRLAGNYGVGFLLTAESALMKVMCNHTFTETQIDVLVTLALKTRPGSIRIFNALDPIVASLMFGEIRDDLQRTILDDNVGLLGKRNLETIREDDKRALASQRTEFPWVVVDSKLIAEQKLTALLRLST